MTRFIFEGTGSIVGKGEYEKVEPSLNVAQYHASVLTETGILTKILNVQG